MEPRAFVDQLAGDIERIVGADLVGIYLHGSLALGCFNPARSDVDLLVVTRERMSSETRRAVADLMLASSGNPYPIEISFLTLDQLRPWRYPTPFDFHFGESHRQALEDDLRRGQVTRVASTDWDLAGHVGLLHARGEVGAPIDAAFPPIPEADFRDSILRDFEWIRRPGTRMGGRIYGVLNACRVFAWLRGRGIVSKAEAGDWALGVVSPELRPTLRKAVAAYRQGGDEPCTEEEARRFVSAVALSVEELTARSD